MKYVDEFRDRDRASSLTLEIARVLGRIPRARHRPLKIMEVCGGHTHSIFRYGIEGLLPPSLELIHGPGCPVCVLPIGRVDDGLAIAAYPGVIFATFGDAMRVPGSSRSLLQAKAEGLDIRMVYSPMDALALAHRHPDREVVLFGLGFETTMPSTALTILAAAADHVRNFSVFCNHITIVPTLRALLDSPAVEIDGFLGPGHVSAVIGTLPFQFVAERYHRPFVVAGFEPLDVLQAIWMILLQLEQGRADVENQYARVVASTGSRQATGAIAEVYEPRERFEWRGLGSIDHSGIRIRPAYAAFDAEVRFAVPNAQVADPAACRCGDVLKGIMRPHDCKMFGTTCTPETPLGALMVSSEGACAASYHYGGARLTGASHLRVVR
jgi:hydrogenase expression/formation protein HypD